MKRVFSRSRECRGLGGLRECACGWLGGESASAQGSIACKGLGHRVGVAEKQVWIDPGWISAVKQRLSGAEEM